MIFVSSLVTISTINDKYGKGTKEERALRYFPNDVTQCASIFHVSDVFRKRE